MENYIIWCEISAFLASLLAWPVIRRSSYLRLFPLLLGLIVGVEAYFTFFQDIVSPVNAIVYNIQIPLQHLCYLAILYYATENANYRRFLLLAAGVFILIILISLLLLKNSGHMNVWGYCAGSTILIVGIILKFYEMLQNPTEFNFLKNPFFYMLFAFLLFNLGTLPYFAMSNWLYTVKGYRRTVLMYADAMSILNYILYLTYTIAFLWMIRMKGSF